MKFLSSRSLLQIRGCQCGSFSLSEPGMDYGHSKSVGEGAGVGVKDTHEVEQSDDAFDQYRKRMMLAYRFRPNPLNNPRRTYY